MAFGYSLSNTSLMHGPPFVNDKDCHFPLWRAFQRRIGLKPLLDVLASA
jgi:hypothetical protein